MQSINMTIIQINAVYGKGSTGRNVAEMDAIFKSRGYGSYVVATRLDERYDNVYEIGNRAEWYFHQGMSLLTGHQGYFSRSSTKKMLHWIDEIHPDVIHLNNIRAGAFNYPLLFEYLNCKDIPVVLTLHDCFLFTGRCWHFTLKGCYQWETRCIRCPSTEMCERSLFFDFSRSLFDDKKKWFTGINRLAVVGVSDWITGEAKRSFLKKADIIDTVYNWVDLDIFKPAAEKMIRRLKVRLNIEFELIVVCVASVLSIEKGLHEIITLSKELPWIGFVLVGKIDKRIKLPSNVIKVGMIRDVKLLSLFYSMADVMVNPSPEETFGKTTAESLACGTPVVGYDMTATSELLNDQIGVLVDYKDKEKGMKEAIMKVLRNGKASYTAECRRFAEDNFEMRKNIEKYIGIYNRLIQGDVE